MKVGKATTSILAYHGTDKTDSVGFDVAKAGHYNIGLHFGTRAPREPHIPNLAAQAVLVARHRY